MKKNPQTPLKILDARFVAAAAPGSELPAPTLAEVAFAGRSNVGKSSLLNTLLARKGLVRAGATPGTTRQINVFLAEAEGGLTMHLVDLPGYGYAKRSRGERAQWGPLIEGYLSERVTLRAVVLIVDVRRGLETEEKELLEFIAGTSAKTRPVPRTILVATKVDKVGRAASGPALARIAKESGVVPLGFSAHTGQGREELWRLIKRTVTGTESPISHGIGSPS